MKLLIEGTFRLPVNLARGRPSEYKRMNGTALMGVLVSYDILTMSRNWEMSAMAYFTLLSL